MHITKMDIETKNCKSAHNPILIMLALFHNSLVKLLGLSNIISDTIMFTNMEVNHLHSLLWIKKTKRMRRISYI